MFLVIVCVLSWFVIDMLVLVRDYSPDVSGMLGDAEGEERLILGLLAGVAAAAPYFFILGSGVLLIILSLPCLLGSISNARVKFKPVRIINIVLSCLFGAALALGVTAIILFKVL